MNDLREKTISSEVKYTGTIVTIRRDDVLLSNGMEHYREVVEHPGGVVIVPVLDNSKIVLVRQWRYPVGVELIELPAGKLTPEERKDTLAAAKRELQEETGFIANSWESLGFIYTAPGFCDEKLFLYKAYDLVQSVANLDYGEIVEPFIVEIEQAKKMIKSGEITDAKTIVGINLVSL